MLLLAIPLSFAKIFSLRGIRDSWSRFLSLPTTAQGRGHVVGLFETPFLDLRPILLEDSDRKLVIAPYRCQGRNAFIFFCGDVSGSTASFFTRVTSFCGSSCPSNFKASAIAASA